MKVVFASHNAGKIKELKVALQAINLDVIPQGLLGINEMAETGVTFVENAILKARHASLQSGLPAIADDSGLEVDVLKGAPGIYSARYAGEKATAQENIQKLLHELKPYSNKERQANFYCVLVFLSHPLDPTPLICEASWCGVIANAPIGENGFGYDPIFFDPEVGLTAAQLPFTKKNRISHRGKALQLLIEKLRGIL